MLAQKRACPHKNQHLVQQTFRMATFDDDGNLIDVASEEQWFAAWQCTDCGNVTQKPVTADDLEEARHAPWLDKIEYARATQERLEEQADWVALQFGLTAVKPRNGRHK